MKKKYLIYSLIIILQLISFISSYNNSALKNVTANDLQNYSRTNGYEGCYALYDSGANETATCTQFKLETPYICCKVHYQIGDFKNDFCMPISNNEKALKDVVNSFDNADEIEIDCNSLPFEFSFSLFLILFILLI